MLRSKCWQIEEVLDLGHGAHSVERVGFEAKAE